MSNGVPELHQMCRLTNFEVLKIATVFEHGSNMAFFFSFSYLGPHDIGVFSINQNWFSIPAQIEVKIIVGRFNISRVTVDLGLCPVHIQGDADST